MASRDVRRQRWDPRNLLVHQLHDRALLEMAARYLRGDLVDIGCGPKPYRDLLAPFVVRHIGVDHVDSMHGTDAADLIGTAYAIPAPDAAFDSALCSAVLEHLEEPEAALRECHRVLKPKGHAVYSVPFIWHLHEEPRDFYRYTKYGLRHLFEKTGFEVVELKPLSGFWVTFGTLFLYNLYRLNRGPIRKLHLLDPVAFEVRTVARALDSIDRTEQWTWMYMVAAQKR